LFYCNLGCADTCQVVVGVFSGFKKSFLIPRKNENETLLNEINNKYKPMVHVINGLLYVSFLLNTYIDHFLISTEI
jgi:hypothetical protein